MGTVDGSFDTHPWDADMMPVWTPREMRQLLFLRWRIAHRNRAGDGPVPSLPRMPILALGGAPRELTTSDFKFRTDEDG